MIPIPIGVTRNGHGNEQLKYVDLQRFALLLPQYRVELLQERDNIQTEIARLESERVRREQRSLVDGSYPWLPEDDAATLEMLHKHVQSVNRNLEMVKQLDEV